MAGGCQMLDLGRQGSKQATLSPRVGPNSRAGFDQSRRRGSLPFTAVWAPGEVSSPRNGPPPVPRCVAHRRRPSHGDGGGAAQVWAQCSTGPHFRAHEVCRSLAPYGAQLADPRVFGHLGHAVHECDQEAPWTWRGTAAAAAVREEWPRCALPCHDTGHPPACSPSPLFVLECPSI